VTDGSKPGVSPSLDGLERPLSGSSRANVQRLPRFIEVGSGCRPRDDRTQKSCAGDRARGLEGRELLPAIEVQKLQ
jgi:hypothetical protein